MYLTDLMDIGLLQRRVEEGYVRSQVHPWLPLKIYNYAEKAQYERVWDEVTTQTRGLVVDNDMRVIILPLPKFFNYEEHLSIDELPGVPNEQFKIQEKLDGSLFLARRDPEHGLVTASRGSFMSEQAIIGREFLTERYRWEEMRDDLSYVCEVIYPENRIVVNYGNSRELVLLAIRKHSENGKELSIGEMSSWADTLGMRPPAQYSHIRNLESAKSYIPDDEEGYVIRFHSGLRMKIKGDEYVRLHRIVTGINSKHIWEWLRDGRSVDDLLVDVPDEFYRWVQQTVTELQDAYRHILETATFDANAVRDLSSRKEQAAIITKCKYPGISFALLDGNTEKASDGIWRMVKPIATSPFSAREG